MKKILILLVLLTFGCSDSDSNSNAIFTGDVLLETQEQINEFGKNNYQIIKGQLNIIPSSPDNIIDLSPLNSITQIDKLVSITSSQLEIVELNTIEVGGLIIYGECKSINFPNLIEITGGLEFFFNDLLETINFPKLNSVATHLSIRSGKIQNLDGFRSLTHLGFELVIFDNPMLSSLAGLVNINSEVERLRIGNNDNLSSLDGVDNIKFRGTHILNNNNLTDLCAIQNNIASAFFRAEQYWIERNGYNPTFQEMLDSNCSQ